MPVIFYNQNERMESWNKSVELFGKLSLLCTEHPSLLRALSFCKFSQVVDILVALIDIK